MVGVPQPARVNAQGLTEFPHLKLDRTCASIGFDDVPSPERFVVSGYGFQPGSIVALTWDSSRVAPPADAITVDAFGVFVQEIFVPTATDTFTHQLLAYYADALAVEGAPSAAVSVNVPCLPTIAITPACGDGDLPVNVHVDGSGFVPNLLIQARITDPIDPQIVHAQAAPQALDPNAVSIDIPFTPPGPGTFLVIVDQVPPVGSEIFDWRPYTAVAHFTAPCAIVAVTPTCESEGGPPDRYRLFVSGANFQPGGPLVIRFDPLGVNHEYIWDFSVGPDGLFGPIEINPYARGPATYEIVVSRVVASRFSPGDGVVQEARASITVPCPPATVTLNPTCAAPQFAGDAQRAFALEVRGSGFQPGAPVQITFDPDMLSGPGYAPEIAQSSAGPDGSVLANFPAVLARPVGRYRVLVQQTVGAAVIDVSAPSVDVPCTRREPRLRLRCELPDTNVPESAEVVVVARDFYEDAPLELTIGGATTTVRTDSNGTYRQALPAAGFPNGALEASAIQRDANGVIAERRATLGLPCGVRDPLLLISPPAAAGGTVVTVEGINFRPNATVSLQWSRGIGRTRTIDVVADADGLFSRQILIFHHDFSGARELAVVGSDDQFATGVTVDFTVVPGRGSPPAIGGPGLPGAPPIVIRR